MEQKHLKINQFFIGEAFWIGFGILSAVLALLAGTRLLTQLMSPEEYGRLALAVSLATLATHIFGESIGKTAVRFYASWCKSGTPVGFVKNIVKSTLVAGGCIVLFCFFAIILTHYANSFSYGYFIAVTGIFAIFLVVNRVALALEDAARKRCFRGMMQGGFEVMRFLFAVLFIFFLQKPVAEVAMSGFVIGTILVVLAHGIFLRQIIYPDKAESIASGKTISLVGTSTMRSFQVPLIASNGCIWLVMMAERWVLSYYSDPGDVGGYAAVYQLAFVPMLFVSNFLILLIEPVLYQMAETKRKSVESTQSLRVNNYAAIGILIFSVIFFVMLFFWHPVIGSLFLGPEFRSYTWLFPWLLFAGGCFATAQQLLLRLSYDMRTDLLAVLWGGMAVLAVAAYIIGAYFWQLKGVLVAMVAVNVLFVVFLMVFLNKKYSNSIITLIG